MGSGVTNENGVVTLVVPTEDALCGAPAARTFGLDAIRVQIGSDSAEIPCDWRATGEQRFLASQRQAFAALDTAQCLTPTTSHGCDSVQAFLRQFPPSRQLPAARAMLDQAEPKLLLLRAAEQWSTIDRDACNEPRTPNACGAVGEFLVHFPRTPEASEARNLIDHAEPKLALLREGEAWGRVDQARCKEPLLSTACDSVEEFLRENPAGSHASEAKKLIAGSAPKVEALRRAEGVRHAKELRDREALDAQAERVRRAREMPDTQYTGAIRRGDFALACRSSSAGGTGCLPLAWKNACDRGDGQGCHDLGLMYLHGGGGFGDVRDLTRAAQYFTKACAQNGSFCMGYGQMYASGVFGRGPNDARTTWFWSRACAYDPATNCANIGLLYETGSLYGLAAEGRRALAKKYYVLACQAGNAFGCSHSR